MIEVPIGPEDLIEDSFAFSSRENELTTTTTTTRRPVETSTPRRRPTPAFPTVQTQRFIEPRPTTTQQQRRFESTSHQPIVNFKVCFGVFLNLIDFIRSCLKMLNLQGVSKIALIFTQNLLFCVKKKHFFYFE